MNALIRDRDTVLGTHTSSAWPRWWAPCTRTRRSGPTPTRCWSGSSVTVGAPSAEPWWDSHCRLSLPGLLSHSARSAHEAIAVTCSGGNLSIPRIVPLAVRPSRPPAA